MKISFLSEEIGSILLDIYLDYKVLCNFYKVQKLRAVSFVSSLENNQLLKE